jgi:hypothetical protein
MLAFIGLITWIAMKDLLVQRGSISAYPAPGDTKPSPSSLSPEALCDQWFSYRKGLPEDQRKFIEEDYRNCVKARETPSPVGIYKPLPSTPSIITSASPFLTRKAGIGTIIETDFAPLNSAYKIKNVWRAEINGSHFMVYAGGISERTHN